MKRDDIEGVLMIGGLAAGGFLLWKLYNTVTNPNAGTPYEGTGVVGTVGNVVNKILGGAPAAIGSAIGSAIAPTQAPGSSTFYRVLFEDGSYHAVGNASVNADGTFYLGGNRYSLVKDAAGNMFAVAG